MSQFSVNARIIHLIAAAAVTVAMTACSTDAYDAGDGEYSKMRADFSELHTTAEKTVAWAVTDDMDTLRFGKNVSVTWALKTDSVYRALLYYNIGEGKVTPVSVSRVPVLRPVAYNTADDCATDPVVFESAWLSRGAKYLNIGMAVKTGKTDEEASAQAIGARVTHAEQADGKIVALKLLLTHSQNGVPEYYSQRCYVSIALDDIARGAVITLDVNTYDGMRTVTLRNE